MGPLRGEGVVKDQMMDLAGGLVFGTVHIFTFQSEQRLV
jgi:hypothetical protein